MSKYPDLIKAIDDNNMPMARSILIGLANSSISQAVGALGYIQSMSHSIFEPHNETLYPINSDVTTWNEDYWHGVTSDLMHNFSLERYEHLLDVAKAIKPMPETISTKASSIDSNLKLKLDELIDEGNILRIRSEIIGIANNDTREALSAFTYAINKAPDLLQSHDDVNYPIDDNKNSWDNDYWHGLTSDMMHNFSKERFEHMLRVGQYLKREDDRARIPKEESVRQKMQDDYDTEDMTQKDNVLVYILVAAGIVIAIPVALWLIFRK